MSDTSKADAAAEKKASFTSDYLPSLLKSLGTTLILGVGGLLLQNFITQRIDLSLVELGSSSGEYRNVLVVDNYSYSTLENIKFGIATPALEIRAQSQDGVASSEKVSLKEQAITISRALPSRRLWVEFSTPAPIDQSQITKITGPTGATFAQTDRLTSPFYFEAIKYLVFVYSPAAIVLIYFSLRIRRRDQELREHRSDLDKNFRDLRAQLRESESSTYAKLNTLRKTYLFRMRKLADENQFWRTFLSKIMIETLKDGVNPKKIMGMFFESKGVLTEQDLYELEEAEIAYLLESQRNHASPRTSGIPI